MIINIHDDIIRIRAMKLLDKILKDKTTGRNIVWATDAYNFLGGKFEVNDEITSSALVSTGFKLIKTRARKDFEQQSERTKQHAEVFTPMWVCNMMNDYLDESWFGAKDVFSKDGEPTERVIFPDGKDWKQYVDSRRLEITCGEAPFIISRYDVETGEIVPVKKRIGFLDRKLRVVNENAKDEEEWIKWALRAFQATYGYEFQGDNLLIARINCLMTFEDYMKERWQHKPELKDYAKVLNVIVWNIWQMDGLKGLVPYINADDSKQMSLFDMFDNDNNRNSQPDCLIHNWRRQRTVKYLALQDKGADIVKFDYIIGNPPYQDEVQNKGDRPNPVYDKFMEQSFKVADVVELIHPARFLYNAGQTSKEWNKKMLNDPHFKVIYYERDSSKVFANVEIKGGVAITFRDANKNYGEIGTFTEYPELNEIVKKISLVVGKSSRLNTIIASQGLYRFSEKFFAQYPNSVEIMGNGTGNKIVSSVMEKLPEVFLDSKPTGCESIRFMGRIKNKRVYKYIERDYIIENEFIDKYNLFIPEANNTGKYGETLTDPTVAYPLDGAADTFLSAGQFDTEIEPMNFAKYMKTKFFRSLLGVKKVTQHCPPGVWSMIPLQDFTPNSDIDWTKSIKEIDQQLYKKYGLDESEIEFIETHVKEME